MALIIQISTIPIALEEIAKELKLDKRTLLKYGIPAFRMGKKWVVSPVALIDWQSRMLQSDEYEKARKGRRHAKANSLRKMESSQTNKRKIALDFIIQKQNRGDRSRKKPRNTGENENNA